MTEVEKRTIESQGGRSPKRCKDSGLDKLKAMTSVVADTGDFEALEKYKPEDATTNPTLLLQAVQMPKYAYLLDEAIAAAKEQNLKGDDLVMEICDQLAVSVGCKLLEFLPDHGRVSTEVDANLSFDTKKSLAKARKLIGMYKARGIPTSKILIKLGSTWECIEACKELEKEGIHCNMTLLFGFHQAVACAEANATLISPFVGRILDWYKKSTGKTEYPAEEDPGVLSV